MALATPDEPEITRRALFKERDKVYPKSVKGRFRKLKWTASDPAAVDLLHHALDTLGSRTGCA